MEAKTAIGMALDCAEMICDGYLADLTDAEMMHRPAPECNHIKWQLGHLIQSEHNMINGCYPGQMPPLPNVFAERYSRATSHSDDASQFDSKELLLDLYRQQRAATRNLLNAATAEDLDRPAPESIRSYAPTVGAAFLMQDAHWMMHAGQWAVIRRQLGRSPLF